MSSHLNLIGSFIIGGLLFLMIGRFYSSMSQNSHERTLDSITIQTASGISDLIEFDFNRMGLGAASPTTALFMADSNRIGFLSDIDHNGVVDTVRYILSDVNAASNTENPRDKILYRLVSNEPQINATLGVTEFKIRYFDSLGYETTDITQMKNFDISLMVESTTPYDNRYSQFYWQTRISPPNLLRF